MPAAQELKGSLFSLVHLCFFFLQLSFSKYILLSQDTSFWKHKNVLPYVFSPWCICFFFSCN